MCSSKWLHLTQTQCRVMLRSFYFRIMWLCDGCGKLFGRSRPIREHTKATQVHLGSCQMFSWKIIEKGKIGKFRPRWPICYMSLIEPNVHFWIFSSAFSMQQTQHSRIRQSGHIFAAFIFSIFCFVIFVFIAAAPLQPPERTVLLPFMPTSCNSAYRFPTNTSCFFLRLDFFLDDQDGQV